MWSPAHHLEMLIIPVYYPMILSHPIICSCWEIHITLLYYWSILLFKLFSLTGRAIYVFLCDGAWGFWPAVCALVDFYTLVELVSLDDSALARAGPDLAEW